MLDRNESSMVCITPMQSPENETEDGEHMGNDANNNETNLRDSVMLGMEQEYVMFLSGSHGQPRDNEHAPTTRV